MRRILLILMIGLGAPVVTGVAQEGTVLHQTFQIAESCKVQLAGDKPGKLEDLNSGDRIALSYHKEEEILVARFVRVLGEPGKTPSNHGKDFKNDSDLHVYGVLTSVDKEAHLIKVDVHPPHDKKAREAK